MSDENNSQNSNPEENPLPTSPKEPMVDAPIPLMDSEPDEVLSDSELRNPPIQLFHKHDKIDHSG